MYGYVETKRVLILDEEAYNTLNDCKILIDDMVANSVDMSILLTELQEVFNAYMASFDEIKKG